MSDRQTAINRTHTIIDALEMGLDVPLGGFQFRLNDTEYCIVATQNSGEEKLLRPFMGSGFPLEVLVKWAGEMSDEDFMGLVATVGLNRIKRSEIKKRSGI